MNANLKIVERLKIGPNSWPMPPRGYKINSIQKLIEPHHVIGGLPKNIPPIYYKQNWTGGVGIARNRNVSTLGDGVYLYLIEYDPTTNQYYKQFVPIINLLESGSRHFQLPTHIEGRVIIAAGELIKQGSVIKYNLESGTYTRNLMSVTNKHKINRSVYRNIVENAFRNAKPNLHYQNAILAPQVQVRLGHIVKKIPSNKLSFEYGGRPTARLRASQPKYHTTTPHPVLSALHRNRKQAGNSNSNSNKENSSPARASPSSRKRKANNGGPNLR
jgi:hypothetical protein